MLSGLLTAGLAWSLTHRAIPSLLAGVVFAFFPNRLEHLNSPMVQMGFLLPAILWAYIRFLEEARWRHLLVLVLALWGQIFSSLYYAFAAGFLLLAVGLGWLLLRPDTLSWRLVARGALGVGGLALAAGPFLAPYLSVHRALGFERDEGVAEWFGMDLLSWLDPGAFSTLYGNRLLSLRHSEGGLFPGFVVLGLVAATLLWASRPGAAARQVRWAALARAGILLASTVCLLGIVLATRKSGATGRVAGIKIRAQDLTWPVNALPLLAWAWTAIEGRRRSAGPLSAREWILVLGPAALWMYLLTLTPTLTVLNRPRGTALFHWVYTYVPGAAAFRAPGRWALVLVLPLALLAAIGLAAMIDRLPRWARGLVPAGVLAAVLIELLPHPIPWQKRPPVPRAHRWLAGQPGDFAVAVLPANDGRHAAWSMLWATTHWKRLVNGAFVFVPPTVQALADEEDPIDADALVATLQSIYPLRYVILNRPLLSPAETAAWERIHHDPGRGVAFVGRFGDDDLFAVAGAPQQGVVLRRWFSADFVRRHPRAEYALTLAGAEPEASRKVEVRFNGRLLATHDGPARGAVDLEPPYRAGDRNELSFTHVYTIEPGAISTLAYRIGTTGVHAPVDITAISGAKPYGNRASIRVNGQELVEGTPRGYVVAALDPRDGRPMGIDWFDTFLRAGESRRMARFIESLPSGTIVVAAARDEASGQLEETAVRALRSVGAREDLRGHLWVSHVVIGVKGAEAGQAVEAAGPTLLRASVGRDRPLETVLESFELR